MEKKSNSVKIWEEVSRKTKTGVQAKAAHIETLQLVVFAIDKEEYAIPIGDLDLVMRMEEVTPIPGVSEFIRGIINVRGRITIIVDLEKRFSEVSERTEVYKYLIVTSVNGNAFGVMVDSIIGIYRVPMSAVVPTPAFASSKVNLEYIMGIVALQGKNKLDSKTIVLMNLRRMLGGEELSGLGEVVRSV